MASFEQLVERVESRANPGKRFVLAISGPPGSGKTTLAEKLVNELAKQGHKAAQIAMDGFHYSRAELDLMDDPISAHKFRGAPFTFDFPKIKQYAAKLHTRESVTFPSFDHAKKDPQSQGVTVEPDIDIIIFEGNYLLLNIDGWQELTKYWDDRWLLKESEETLRQRLGQRHLRAGLVDSLQEGYDRADFNDIPNGRLIMANSSYDLQI